MLHQGLVFSAFPPILDRETVPPICESSFIVDGKKVLFLENVLSPGKKPSLVLRYHVVFIYFLYFKMNVHELSSFRRVSDLNLFREYILKITGTTIELWSTIQNLQLYFINV